MYWLFEILWKRFFPYWCLELLCRLYQSAVPELSICQKDKIDQIHIEVDLACRSISRLHTSLFVCKSFSRHCFCQVLSENFRLLKPLILHNLRSPTGLISILPLFSFTLLIECNDRILWHRGANLFYRFYHISCLTNIWLLYVCIFPSELITEKLNSVFFSKRKTSTLNQYKWNYIYFSV